MNLLLLCPHFRPDLHAATGEVMTQLVEELVERGHHITVITSLPWYRGHRVADEWRGRPWRREKTGWGEIIRVWPFPTDKTTIADQLTQFTDIAGDAQATKDATHIYGPYLHAIPRMKVGAQNGKNGISDTDGAETAGWIYLSASGKIYANCAVGVADLAIVVADWGDEESPWSRADLAAMLAAWGSACPL